MARARRKNRGPAKKRRALTVEQLEELGADVSAYRREHWQPEAVASREAVMAGPKRNKTEARYEVYLGLLLQAGAITGWVFEGIKLRLGPDWLTTYTPDFMVQLGDGVVELHDVKGASSSKGSTAGAWWEEDARLKIKVAAGLYPFRFVGVHEDGLGGWVREVFPPG